ncbi:hypothetical protein [Pseudomonas aeruginosa]
MDNKPLINPGKLFLICIALLAYAGLSVALVGGIGPALVSSRDDVLVFAGFAIPAPARRIDLRRDHAYGPWHARPRVRRTK